MTDPEMSVGVVARLFKVTRGTVRYWIATGKLKADRKAVGGWYRIRSSAVTAMIEKAQKEQSPRHA